MVDLDTWAERLRSDSTRASYMLFVRRFLEFHNVGWEDTLKWSLNEAEDRTIAFREHMVKQGMAGKSIQLALTALKRWFWDNRIRTEVKLGVATRKTYLDYIPSKADLQTLLDSVGKPHMKMGIMLMAFSGLRPVDVVTLQFQHIKASFRTKDEVLTIIKRHQKTGDWYPTFLGPQGTRFLREYLKRRESKGEHIKDRTYIVQYLGKKISSGSFTKALQRLILATVGRHPTGEPFRKFRPYGLRKYFRRAVGAMGESEAEFLMGHIRGLRSLEATYSGLRDLDPQAIENLKEKYIRILPELETELTDASVRARIEHLEAKESEMEDMRREVTGLRTLVEALREAEELEDLAEDLDDSESPP